MGILGFKAANGWLEKKNSIGNSVRLFGKAGDVDMAVLTPHIDMDESVLLFQTLPLRTYLGRSDGSHQNVEFILIIRHLLFYKIIYLKIFIFH